jgi:hypothetical protein
MSAGPNQKMGRNLTGLIAKKAAITVSAVPGTIKRNSLITVSDGPIYGQITHNRLQNIFLGREKMVILKLPIFFPTNSSRKEVENYFRQIYKRSPPYFFNISEQGK